jgi:RNA polymerase sigma-70 factor (ECF subfamily)
MQDAPEDPEVSIRVAHQGGYYDAAATLTLELYGREIMGFIAARSASHEDASDIFSQLSEDLWKGLPAFEWRCSIRTWAYRLARNAAFHQRKREKRGGPAVSLSNASRMSEMVERVRTETHAHLRTEVKTRFQQIREQLSAEDQTLLILRVDRNMSWRELAIVMLAEGEDDSEESIKREAARLRKRFQFAKDQLRALALEAGLINHDTQ